VHLLFQWVRLVRLSFVCLNPSVSFIDLIEHIECFADRCSNRVASVDELSLVTDVLVEVIKQLLGISTLTFGIRSYSQRNIFSVSHSTPDSLVFVGGRTSRLLQSVEQFVW